MQYPDLSRCAGQTWGERVDLTDFHCMLVVAEEESITRAAARLYLSQPALSRRIRRLERSVGSSLFLRHSRSVSLTPAGTALAEHARAVIVAAEVALQSARAMGVRAGRART
jgi:DNA-binding transcriptional LysR family regulator